ncbi:MAG: TIGR00282 family metallophosphoesterase [Parcubacteria group bacterium]
MTILFIGDIVGKPGRAAVAKVLPGLRDKYKVDLVIANGENLAHGRGATPETINELIASGVDFMTSGNHWADQKEMLELADDKDVPFIRPANYPPGVPGRGWQLVPVRTKKVLVINLMGRVFLHGDLDDPFRKLDQILEENAAAKPDAIIVDFHAEATSEAVAFGFFADGRVTACLGTHSHVPTDDAWVLPKGTGHVTDVGMVGPRDSVLGLEKTEIIKHFLTQLPFKTVIPDSPEVCFDYALVHTDTKRKGANDVALCSSLTRHTEIVTLG